MFPANFDKSLPASIIALALVSLASPALAADWTGYLVDRMCSDSHKDDPGALNFAQHHTRDCALMCRAGGYALFTEGRWLNLDKSGDALAERLIRSSKRERGFRVKVSGDLAGSTIKVKQIKEIATAQDKQ